MELKMLELYRDLAPAIRHVKKIANEMNALGSKTDENVLITIQGAMNALNPLARRRRVVYKGRHNYLVTVDGGIEVNESYNYRKRYYKTVRYEELFRVLQAYGSYILPVIRAEKYETFEEFLELVGRIQLSEDFSVYISDFEKKVPILKDNGVFQRVKVEHIAINGDGKEKFGEVHYLYNGRKISISEMANIENLAAFEALQDEIIRAYRKIWLEIPERAKRNEEIAAKIEELVTPYKVANRLAEN